MQDDTEVMDKAKNGREGVESTAFKPDIILMDPDAEMDGIEVTKHLKSGRKAKSSSLTSFMMKVPFQAINAGARAGILKTASASNRAIRDTYMVICINHAFW